MRDVESFVMSPEGTREEMMRATYLALCDHGYADLTIQRIDEEFPKSKSLIYHHYDGKDDLLLDFLSFMLEQFESSMPFEEAERVDEHLETILDYAFTSALPERRREFTRAMVELRSQAANDEAYRAHFTRHDRFFSDRLETILETGVEEGVFRPVDPGAVAAYLMTVINGTMVLQVTSEFDDVAAIRDQLDAYLRTVLLPEG